MEIFKDRSFSKSAHDASENFIGEELFVRISWKNNGLEKFRFVIDTCFVRINEMDIDFIRKTCYSETLGAKMLSPSKLHATVGKFSFLSFAPEPTKKHVETRVICDLRLCLASNCQGEIVENVGNCPAGKWESMHFSPYGI